MTTNLNRSADGAGAGLNIVSWEIEEGFAYNIGSLTVPLELTADSFADRGNGSLYFSSSTGTAALNTDRLIIDKGGIGGIVYLTGSFTNANASNITKLEVVRGLNVYLAGANSGFGDGSTSITSLWVTPRDLNSVKVTCLESVNITDIFVSGGTLVVGPDNSSSIGAVHLGNGVLEFYGIALALLNQSGGLVLHNGTASNYPITLYNAFGGSLETRNTPGRKLISTMNRAPTFEFPRNPLLTISTENFIGG